MKPMTATTKVRIDVDNDDPRRRPSASHGRSLSRLGLRRRANQPGHQPGPQTVAEPLRRIGIARSRPSPTRTGSVGTENGYMPAVRVSAPSAKNSVNPGGSHGR